MNQMWFLSEPSDSQVEFQAQFFQIHTRQVSHLHMLQVMPASCVQWVEVRCIAGQRFQVDPGAVARRQERLHLAVAMDRRTVPDHDQRSRQATLQMFQKLHHFGAREGPIIDQHQEVASGRHAADDGEMVGGDRLRQHRRLPPRGIGHPHERQQVEPGLIYEDERGAEASPLFASAG